MQIHLEKSKNEHTEITALKCKSFETELAEIKLLVAKLFPNPTFIQPPDITMTGFDMHKKRR